LKRLASTPGEIARGFAPAAVLVCTLGAPVAEAQLNCNPGIEFYDSGPLKQCNLNGDHRLHTVRGDVIVCANAHVLVQFPDGRLRSCAVIDNQVIAGERCEAPARVELAHDGSLLRCEKI